MEAFQLSTAAAEQVTLIFSLRCLGKARAKWPGIQRVFFMTNSEVGMQSIRQNREGAPMSGRDGGFDPLAPMAGLV
jgi:hypothetical protein